MRALIALCLVIAAVTAAGATSRPSDAQFAALARMPRWQALLHINPGATLRGIGDSYVDDPAFFLAPDGVKDPAAELRATWAALKTPGSPKRCRYPARYRFLAEQLHWQEPRPLSHCADYQKWRAQMPLGQLVLVFPDAYLNSPSSMFGHTLLRLDASKNPESVWLSKAINFGARINADDNSIFYIWRGLAGGYPGYFSVVPYLEKIREYGFIENRDMWEYTLNLDRSELDWLVRHLWELRGVRFNYYFFDENCSFRLLELIKVARPAAPLLDRLRFAELPANTVRQLYRAHLVAASHYRPSKVNELNHLVDQLTPQELDWAHALRRDPAAGDTDRFRQLPPRRRHLVAEVAYKALRVAQRDQPRTDEVARHSLDLLRIEQRNPPAHIKPITPPSAPETGHKTQMATLAGGRWRGHNFAELGYRLTYHGVLDPLKGYLPGAGIKGLNLRLRFYDNGNIDLQNLDLVDIRSISPRSAFSKPISWFVRSGVEQTPVRDSLDPGLFLQGGPGASWQFGNLMPYAFAVSRIETVHHQNPVFAVGAGPEIGAIYVTRRLQFGARARMIYYAQHFFRRRVSVTLNVPVTTNNAVRAECGYASWRSNGQSGCQLEFRHFFN